MSESTYHQIHFAWAEPTLLGRMGPGPAASSLTESDQPSLRSWRDRLVPALTVDYRAALPGTDPADLPETLWSRTYADGQAALVYRWPGDVRDAHAWAVVGPAHGLTLPRILSLHENPNTRPAASRPPAPGWASMPTLAPPAPWELTAAPGAVRTRDRRAAETTVQGEAVLVGAVSSALRNPEKPIRIALEPEDADLWQATQIRLLWGVHRTLHDLLTPPRAIPAAGWQWSFSTYDPELSSEGQHLAFGPPGEGSEGPYMDPPPPEHRRVAERLVEVLRDEGGDALAEHLRERGVPDAPTFGDRRALLLEWLDPRAATVASGPGPGADVSRTEEDDTAVGGTVFSGGAEDEEGVFGARSVDEADLPTAEPLPTDDEVERETASGPGESAADPPGPLGPTDGPAHVDEHHRARPYPLSRSMAGAHPSFRLHRPTEDDEGEPLPEAEDLDAPLPTDEEPTGEVSADRPPTQEVDQRPPGPSRVLFGERRPGSTARAEHPIFGAPEPHEPPSKPTDEAPPLNLSRTPDPAPPEASGESRSILENLTTTVDDLEHVSGHLDAEHVPARTGARRHAEEAFGGPARMTEEEAAHAEDTDPDYATETEPETDPDFDDSGANWPTQYADLPLARLERWHSKRGPEGAHTDVVDARAAVRAERSELHRVREERDHYHSEVQDLRREVARLDRPFLDGHEDGRSGTGTRRWPVRLLILVLMSAFLATGLEAGARFGISALDMLAALLP